MRATHGVVLAVLLALMGSACTGAPTTDAGDSVAGVADPGPAEAADQPPELPSTLRWKRCGRAPFECATLRVPVSYARPKGRKLAIKVIRLPAPKAADRIG